MKRQRPSLAHDNGVHHPSLRAGTSDDLSAHDVEHDCPQFQDSVQTANAWSSSSSGDHSSMHNGNVYGSVTNSKWLAVEWQCRCSCCIQITCLYRESPVLRASSTARPDLRLNFACLAYFLLDKKHWVVRPKPNSMFMGQRQLLSMLETSLHGYRADEQPRCWQYVLQGIGGVGKSEVALQFAMRCRQR